MIADFIFPIVAAILFLVFAGCYMALVLCVLWFVPKVFLILFALWIIGSMIVE